MPEFPCSFCSWNNRTISEQIGTSFGSICSNGFGKILSLNATLDGHCLTIQPYKLTDMIVCVADHSGVEWASMLVTDDVDIEFYFLTRCK